MAVNDNDTEGPNFKPPMPRSRVVERERSQSIALEALEEERAERRYKTAQLRKARLAARTEG